MNVILRPKLEIHWIGNRLDKIAHHNHVSVHLTHQSFMEERHISSVDKMMKITNLMIFGNLISQLKFTLKLSSDQILLYLNADLVIQLIFSMVKCTFSVAS